MKSEKDSGNGRQEEETAARRCRESVMGTDRQEDRVPQASLA